MPPEAAYWKLCLPFGILCACRLTDICHLFFMRRRRLSHDSHCGPGEMSDAAEVLGAIYDSLGTMPEGKALVDAVFGLHVREEVRQIC